MNTKRLGVVVLVLSVLLAGLVIYIIAQLQGNLVTYSCLPTAECKEVSSQLGFSHVVVGILVAFVSLGFYLVFFGKDENLAALLRNQNEEQLKDEKFAILLKALDPFEQKILKIIMHETEVEQNTLRLKANISKAKVSQVVTDLEKKGLITREKKKKTYLIRLHIDL